MKVMMGNMIAFIPTYALTCDPADVLKNQANMRQTRDSTSIAMMRSSPRLSARMAELRDEVSPKGVFKELNAELRKQLAERKRG